MPVADERAPFAFRIIWYNIGQVLLMMIADLRKNRGEIVLTPGLMKMWISFAAMGFMFLAVVGIYLSRYKLKGFFKIISASIAYLLMVVAGIIIFIVVLSGPVSE
jgi:hypothetical protein